MLAPINTCYLADTIYRYYSIWCQKVRIYSFSILFLCTEKAIGILKKSSQGCSIAHFCTHLTKPKGQFSDFHFLIDSLKLTTELIFLSFFGRRK